MSVRLISIFCLVATAASGTGTTQAPHATPVGPTAADSHSKQLTATGKKAYQFYAEGRFGPAAGLYRQAYRDCLDAGDLRQAARYLNNLAGCRFAEYQYPQAMQAYLDARRLAESASYYEVQGTASMNIASLYLQMGDIEAAAAAAGEGLAVIGRHRRPDFPLAQLLTLMGRIRSLQGRTEEADKAYQEAIGQAMTRGDVAQMARSWDSFGFACLRQRRLQLAETCLIESYRLRLLSHSKEIHLSYTKLALLRLAQHDLASAATLATRAIDSALRDAGAAPLWQIYHTRGLVQEAQGDYSGAFRSFHQAIDDARRWRLGVLPADALRAGADQTLDSIYTSYVRAGARLYFDTGRPDLPGVTFQVMEQSRAASLRESAGAGRGWLGQLPPGYGAALARLRLAEAMSLRGNSPRARETARRARLELLDMETQAGLESAGGRGHPAGQTSLGEIQASLAPGEALISYLVCGTVSYRWVVTGRGISLHKLAGRDRLAALVDASVAALRAGRGSGPEQAGLAHELFLQNEPNLRLATRWLIELDDVLFRAPVAALPDPTTGGRFVIERHSVEILPSILFHRAVGGGGPTRLFAGLGDPIYNHADPRRAAPIAPEHATGLLPWLHAAAPAGVTGPELPRLAASEEEIRRGAEAWSPLPREHLLLFGSRADKDELRRALDRRPSVIHLATHVLKSALRPGEAMIALGFGGGSSAQFLDSTGIRLLQAPGALVVLSGCSTGSGQILRGAGLMGLARAWLLAGAQSVVASHWPTPDDSGEIFAAFYRYLRATPGDFPTALRLAQLEMLQSNSWRSRPSYWAAYFNYGRH